MRSIFLVFVFFFVACGGDRTHGAVAAGWRGFQNCGGLAGVADGGIRGEPVLLWEYAAGGRIEAGAAIDRDTVFVGTCAGEIVALDFRTGARRWGFTTVGAVAATPLVVGDTLYVGDKSGFFYLLDARSGEELARIETGGKIISSANVKDELVFFGSYDQTLYAVDVRTRAVAWKFESEGPVHSTPAVHDGWVYVSGCDGKLRMIGAADGRERRAVDLNTYLGAGFSINGSGVIGTIAGELCGVDPATLDVCWRKSFGEDASFYSTAANDGARVVSTCESGNTYCHEAATGRELWRFATRDKIQSSPVIAGASAIFGSYDGNVYVLNLADGEKIRSFDVGAPVAASPAVAAGRIVIGSADGGVYCFGGAGE